MREHTETCAKWGAFFVIVYLVVDLSLDFKSGVMPDILSLVIYPLFVYLVIIVYGVMIDTIHDNEIKKWNKERDT